MQLEADALIRGERSGLDPRGETIGGGRLNGNIVADARETDVGLSIKYQPHGTIAGVFLLSIHTDLNIAESFRKKPGETANPQNRTLRTLQICQARKKDRLVPDLAGFRDPSFCHQGIDKGERILQGKTGMKRGEPVPYFKGIQGVSVF